MSFDHRSFDPRTFDPGSLDPKSFDPMSVNQVEKWEEMGGGGDIWEVSWIAHG